MMERPILFNTEMVRAVLSGAKTQTRRPTKCQPCDREAVKANYPRRYDIFGKSPFGRPGDLLWVRERWTVSWPSHRTKPTELKKDVWGNWPTVFYRAAASDKTVRKWHPSIHMPRWASRITLRVKRVWVERLLNIDEEAAKAEGMPEKVTDWDKFPCELCHGTDIMPGASIDNYPCPLCRTAHQMFPAVWNSIYGKREGMNWADNPWVWACEFKIAEVRQ